MICVLTKVRSRVQMIDLIDRVKPPAAGNSVDLNEEVRAAEELALNPETVAYVGRRSLNLALGI